MGKGSVSRPACGRGIYIISQNSTANKMEKDPARSTYLEGDQKLTRKSYLVSGTGTLPENRIQ
jgi:hypothetical protein